MSEKKAYRWCVNCEAVLGDDESGLCRICCAADSLTKNLDFGQALAAMKAGKRVRRKEYEQTYRMGGTKLKRLEISFDGEEWNPCGLTSFEVFTGDWELVP